MLSRQCRYLLLRVTFSVLAGNLDTIATIKCHHLLDGYVHYLTYLLFLVIYISTFIWYTAARYGVPCYNSAEAAQLTREAHGGQHEAANGRAKPESDFNMEKIFRAVLVNIIIISMSDLSVHCPACPQISKSECTHPMAEKAKSPLCQPRLFSVRNWSLSKHNWASPQSKASLLTVSLRTHATSNVYTALDDLSPPTPAAAAASPGSHVLLVGQ